MRAMKTTTCVLLLAALTACSEQEPATDEAAQDSVVAADVPAAPAADPNALVDPNGATAEELVAAGLDSAQAAALVAGRPYTSMSAVNGVLQLDSARAEVVYTHVWTPIDLNTASDEDILLIPGIGPRMLREFKEYRPYTQIEEFRREMGKYVDEAEVARLERYVVIR